MTTTYLAPTKGSAATADTHRQIISRRSSATPRTAESRTTPRSPPLSPRSWRAGGDGRPYALAIVLRQGLQRKAGEHGKGLKPLAVQNKDPLLVA